MKTKRMMLLLSATITLWWATGCQKADERLNKSSTIKQVNDEQIPSVENVVTLENWKEVANKHNPYDDSGRRHNEILSALDAHMDITKDGSRQAKHEFIVAYCRKQGIDINKMLSFMTPIMEKAALDDYRSIYDYPTCTTAYDHYLQRLVGIIKGVQTPADWDKFIPAVKSLEDEILRSDIGEDERKDLLIVSSVARYSAAYWYERRPPVPVHDDEMPRWLNAIVRWQAALTCDMMAACLATVTFSENFAEAASEFSAFVHDGIRDHW